MTASASNELRVIDQEEAVEDDAEAGGGDSFDGDSELASPTTRSRKRSSAVERESVRSELHHANTLLS